MWWLRYDPRKLRIFCEIYTPKISSCDPQMHCTTQIHALPTKWQNLYVLQIRVHSCPSTTSQFHSWVYLPDCPSSESYCLPILCTRYRHSLSYKISLLRGLSVLADIVRPKRYKCRCRWWSRDLRRYCWLGWCRLLMRCRACRNSSCRSCSVWLEDLITSSTTV